MRVWIARMGSGPKGSDSVPRTGPPLFAERAFGRRVGGFRGRRSRRRRGQECASVRPDQRHWTHRRQ
jgi:hypothetical protein